MIRALYVCAARTSAQAAEVEDAGDSLEVSALSPLDPQPVTARPTATVTAARAPIVAEDRICIPLFSTDSLIEEHRACDSKPDCTR